MLVEKSYRITFINVIQLIVYTHSYAARGAGDAALVNEKNVYSTLN